MRELRRFRGFPAVADEVHIARAPEPLHIGRSLLSRAMKDLVS